MTTKIETLKKQFKTFLENTEAKSKEELLNFIKVTVKFKGCILKDDSIYYNNETVCTIEYIIKDNCIKIIDIK